MTTTGTRRVLAAAAAVAAIAAAGCGGDDDSSSSESGTTSSQSSAQGADLGAIKSYLTEHSDRLVADTGELRAKAEEYYALAESVDFDYARLLDEKRAEVKAVLDASKTTFTKANPAYEEMEGV